MVQVQATVDKPRGRHASEARERKQPLLDPTPQDGQGSAELGARSSDQKVHHYESPVNDEQR